MRVIIIVVKIAAVIRVVRGHFLTETFFVSRSGRAFFMRFGRISGRAGFETDRGGNAVRPNGGTLPECLLEVTPLFVTENANQGGLRVVHRRVALGKCALPARWYGAASTASPTFASLPLIATYAAGCCLS